MIGVSGALKVICPFDTAHTNRIHFSQKLCICVVPFWRRGQLFLDSCNLFIPHVYLAPLRCEPSEFQQGLSRQKATVPGLQCGFVFVIIHLAVLIEHRLVTDRTDTQTYTQILRRRAIVYIHRYHNISYQSVLNAAARLVFSARRSEHITPLLRDLHYGCGCRSVYGFAFVL